MNISGAHVLQGFRVLYCSHIHAKTQTDYPLFSMMNSNTKCFTNIIHLFSIPPRLYLCDFFIALNDKIIIQVPPTEYKIWGVRILLIVINSCQQTLINFTPGYFTNPSGTRGMRKSRLYTH